MQTRSITCWPPVVISRSSVSTSMPSAAITSHDAVLDLVEALGRAVLERARRGVDGHARHQRREVLGRERRGVGQPAGERDDLRLRGHGHQVAHGRRLHRLRALCEQAGVALEVPRPRAPRCLVSPHASLSSHAASGLRVRPPAGRRDRRRDRHPAVPASAARRGAGVRRPRDRLRRHRLRVPRGVAVPARGAGPRRRQRLRDAPASRRGQRPGRLAAAGDRCGARRADGSGFARRPRLCGLARHRRRRRGGDARLLRRAIAVRPRAEAARSRGAGRAPALRRGRRARRRRRLGPLPAARDPRPGRAGLAARRSAPAGRREVRRAFGSSV